MIKLKKNILLIDQHDKSGFYGNGKFGGNFVAETARKPIEDLSKLFEKLRKNKKFLKKRDYYFKNYIGSPTPFIKLHNLSNYLDGAQIWTKKVSDANGGATWNSNPNAAFRLVSSSATYTVSATDDKYVIYSNAASGTISLPAITSTMSGKEIIIKNISNFNVTINANGSQKIVADFANNSATSATLGVEASNNWVKLIADGTNNQWILFRALF